MGIRGRENSTCGVLQNLSCNISQFNIDPCFCIATFRNEEAVVSHGTISPRDGEKGVVAVDADIGMSRGPGKKYPYPLRRRARRKDADGGQN
jgi:hypothetical protein